MPASILIADDYDDNRELLRLMLESAGHRVRETRDGREFVTAALADSFDLALVDLSMPVLDGWAAIAALRSDERTRRLPCVAVTAFAAELDRQRALDSGFDDYVAKPFRSKDLLEVVDRLLAGRDAHPPDGRARDGAHDGDGQRPAHSPPAPPAPAFAAEDRDA